MREIDVYDVVFVNYSTWKSESLNSDEIALHSGIEAYVDKSIGGRVARVIAVENYYYTVQLPDGKRFSIPKQFCQLLENAIWNDEQLSSTYFYPSGMTGQRITYPISGTGMIYPDGGISIPSFIYDDEKPKRKNDEIETPDDDEIIQRGIQTALLEEKRKNDEDDD